MAKDAHSKPIREYTKKPLRDGTMGRLIKLLFEAYPAKISIAIAFIVFSAIVNTIPAIFQQKVLKIVTSYIEADNFSWAAAMEEILPLIFILIGLYLLSLTFLTLQTQIMPTITQGFLDILRRKMFNGMQNLPLQYFDTNQHGNIMSHYTNDIDALRQLIAQALPNLLQAAIVVASVVFIMLWFSLIMTLIVLFGVLLMFFVSKKIAGGSAKYFVSQQKSMGNSEGYIQEMMTGQKVIKVFNYEKEAVQKFDELNQQLFNDSYKAHAYANALGPIIMNIGSLLYVVTATLGGLFLISGIPNISISGMAFSISILVPFLNMTRQFTGNINQVSQQVNHLAMALAGAKRIFELIDQEPEVDEGKITIVRCTDSDGKIRECSEYSGKWAWKIPNTDGSYDYRLLQGDMRMRNVNFGYEPDHQVLHDISVYAKPGQKVAFVGSTGAGKTTIINLLNRFYDVDDGEITLDKMNVKEIKKSDLRRCLGIVLQDTSLFTGSVYDNIRYGKLEATDEECKAAARLVGADHFIERLPDGYDTLLTNNGANLSQGQRQLIAIARSAVADPPILILDEATSSIDTRTEATVQRGMDMLMQGRTVFVIAHRLSTIMNSDVIMVMEHGRIIERGSHEDLLREQGTYYQLYTGAFELE